MDTEECDEQDRYEGFHPKLQKKRHYEFDSLETKRFPGDKSYQWPEYSDAFHKAGATRPIVNFGHNYSKPPVTEVHLTQNLPNVTPDSNLSVTMSSKLRNAEASLVSARQTRQLDAERCEVEELENWSPACPLRPPSFDAISKRYGPASIGFIRRVSETQLLAATAVASPVKQNANSNNNSNNSRKTSTPGNGKLNNSNSKPVSRGKMASKASSRGRGKTKT